MSDSIGALIQGICSPVRESRRHCIERLVRTGAPAVAPLCEALQSGGLLTRCAAAEALGRIGDRAATPFLIPTLKDRDSEVVERAAAALGALGDPQAVPALCQLARAQYPFASLPAVEALGKLRDVRALSTLSQLLQSEAAAVDLRLAAARALGELGHPGAIRPLSEAMKAPYEGLFVESCRALGKLNTPDAVPILCEAALRAGSMVSAAMDAVCEALVALGPETLPELALRLQYERAAPALMGALERFGPRALPALASVMSRGSVWARARALEVLQELGPLEGESWEIACMGLRDAEERVRVAGLRTVAGSGDQRCAGEVTRMLGDRSPRVRRLAAVVLYRLEPRPELLPAVLQAAHVDDEETLRLAAEALERCAREQPSGELRQAAAVLQRRSGGLFRRLPPETHTACRSALAAIEPVLARVRDLPLPAQAGSGGGDLPIAAAPAAESIETLPIPQSPGPDPMCASRQSPG